MPASMWSSVVLRCRTDPRSATARPALRTSREGAAPPVVIGVADLLKREHRGPVLLRLGPAPSRKLGKRRRAPLKMGELLIPTSELRRYNYP